jgi:mercuric ion transport protein
MAQATRTEPASDATEGAGDGRSQARLIAVGGMLGALAASACCILPLVFVTVGISGAWIGNLTALAPYKPYFAAGTLALVGYGYYLVYVRPKQACADGSCSRPLPGRVVKLSLWIATVLVVVALAFDYVAPLLLS